MENVMPALLQINFELFYEVLLNDFHDDVDQDHFGTVQILICN